MYPTSDDYKTAVAKPARQWRARIEIDDGPVLDDRVLAKIELQHAATLESDFLLGAAGAAQLNIEILDIAAEIPLESIANRTMRPFIGLILPDGTIENIPLGVFVADQPARKDGVISWVAYDQMVTLEKPYIRPGNPPETVGGLWIAIGQQAGLELEMGFESLINMNAAVTHEIRAGTLRQLAGFIAEINAGFAYITRNGKLAIKSFVPAEGADIDIGSGRTYPPVEVSDSALAFDGLLVKSTSDDVGLIYGSDPQKPFVIVGNPLLVDFPQGIIERLMGSIMALNYWPYNMEWQGDPALDTGDIVIIHENRTNTSYLTVVGFERLTYKGGVRSAIGFAAPSEREINTRMANSFLTSQITNAWSEIRRNAEEISFRVSQEIYDAEKPYVGDTPPDDPIEGRLWMDTSSTPNILRKFNSGVWDATGTDHFRTAGIDISLDGLVLDGAQVDIITKLLNIIVGAKNAQRLEIGADQFGDPYISIYNNNGINTLSIQKDGMIFSGMHSFVEYQIGTRRGVGVFTG